jgi:predicted Na+-dependent transporter
MYIVTVISLVWVIAAIVLMIAGTIDYSENIFVAGLVLFCAWALALISFQLGAKWQRFDTLENYELLEKKLDLPKK